MIQKTVSKKQIYVYREKRNNAGKEGYKLYIFTYTIFGDIICTFFLLL